MRYDLIPSRLFTDRRAAFAKKMTPGSIAIFYSNDLMYRSGDQHFPFRQDSALFAMSGLDQHSTILILYPDAKNSAQREIAFILPSDPQHAIWNGDRLNFREAKNISGISTIYTMDKWDKIISPLLLSTSRVYMNTTDHDGSKKDDTLPAGRRIIELKRSYPSITFLPAHQILQQIMMIKHGVELDMMKRAIGITGQAFERVLKTMKPGIKEYEAEAEITYSFGLNGSHHAFEPIVASGLSACTLHYVRNDEIIRPDTLVLLDFGAAYAYMSSDMSRTIPASGRYSTRQRQIYNSVLKILREVTKLMVPGIKIDELNKQTGKYVEQELIMLKIITKSDLRHQSKETPLWKKYFMHGVSHHLGFDVHDIGDRSVPLKAGMVLTCEPGIYIPHEKIGIRLENDILITKNGPKNLMEHIPIEPDEIESIMQTR